MWATGIHDTMNNALLHVLNPALLQYLLQSHLPDSWANGIHWGDCGLQLKAQEIAMNPNYCFPDEDWTEADVS